MLRTIGLSIGIIAVEDTSAEIPSFKRHGYTRAHVKSVCKRDETENISFPSANPRRQRRGDVTAALSFSTVIRGMHFTAVQLASNPKVIRGDARLTVSLADVMSLLTLLKNFPDKRHSVSLGPIEARSLPFLRDGGRYPRVIALASRPVCGRCSLINSPRPSLPLS